MTQNLLIGVRGWQHAAWAGEFYPEELPPEWRFCYYSNRIRSVLVPYETWAVADKADIAGWVDDSDAEFRFVLEPPPILLTSPPSAIEDFFGVAAPLLPLAAGLLLRPPVDRQPDLAVLDRALSAFVARLPVCVDIAPVHRSASVLDLMVRHDVSWCWRPDEAAEPQAQGQFLVALVREGDARTTRHWIEALVRWQGEARQAAMFFEEPAGAVQRALDARTLAELIGV